MLSLISCCNITEDNRGEGVNYGTEIHPSLLSFLPYNHQSIPTAYTLQVREVAMERLH
jgi:hypothetical protein